MRGSCHLLLVLCGICAYPSLISAACISDTDGDGVCDNVDVCPDSLPGAVVNAVGCALPIPGDFDADGDVDTDDYALLLSCESRARVPATPACQAGGFDFDADTDVDMDDFGGFQCCFSGPDVAGNPNCASHSVTIVNGCLRIIGTPASSQLALRLRAGVPSLLDVDLDNNGSADFTFNRAQFNCILIDAGAGDDVVIIDQVNGVFTDVEITTIRGGPGNDTITGGSGAETFIGGPGSDTIQGGASADLFIWNSGDGTDVIDGGDGIDSVEVNGAGEAEQFTIISNGLRVRLDRLSPAPFFLDIGTTEHLVLNAGGGNDTISCTGNLAALIAITIDGGPGDDTILGSNGADVLRGGDDNDFIDGQQGNDVILLGAGDDVFQWDPGDGSDTVEGQAGTDTIVFNGSSAAEIFDFAANGGRLRFTRNIGNVVLDADDVEHFDMRALGGADIATVNSLIGTDLAQIDINLAGTLGGSSGDAQADSVIVMGTNNIDNVAVTGSGTSASVSGLAATVNITAAEPASDRLTINTLGGNDTVQATALPATSIALTLNGGAGNDTLVGGGGEDILNGDADSDILIGGDGNDAIHGGPGNDLIIWNPGDDTDIIDGDEDSDTLEVNGGDGAEQFTITANGLRVRLDRLNPAPFFLDIGTTENLVLNANGGNDSVSCTGNLAALIAITIDGGSGDDTILGSNGADVLIGGDNNDFVDGQQGNDTIFLGAGDDVVQWDPGDGSDVIEGQAGIDTLVFNGSAANENIDISANGARLRFTRDIGTIVLDADDLEKINCNAFGGADNVTVRNLAGTDVTQVTVDLGAVGGIGDTLADNVHIMGTPAAEVFSFSADAGFVVVNLAAQVRVKGYEPQDQIVVNGVGGDTVTVNGSAGADTITVISSGTQARVDATGYSAAVAVSGALSLTINGLGAADTIACTGNLAGIGVPLTLDGGSGEDTILGSNGADVLIGGDDNDFVDGQQGNDTVLLGAGDDVFQWDPGDGSDTVEGQAGADTIVFNGSSAAEIFDFAANGGRLRFTRNIGNIVLDADDVERVDLRALGGSDAVTVNSLAGTDVTQVNLNLAGTLGGNTGDGAVDAIIVNGTPAPDVIHVAAVAGTVAVSGLSAAVNITGSEAANDTLTINGLGGIDTLTQGPGVAALIQLALNQ